MNFESEIKRLTETVNQLARKIDACRNNLENAREFTAKFLDECGKAGLTKVSIARKHESIPQTMKFPFGANGSVFGIGPQSKGGGRDKFGWPAIWGVVEGLGIGGGCGNSMQHQADTSNLIDGVYHLRGGAWHKIDD